MSSQAEDLTSTEHEGTHFTIHAIKRETVNQNVVI